MPSTNGVCLDGGLAVIAVQALLDGRVELDRALEDVELHLELARGLLKDEQLGDVEVHRKVWRDEGLAELLHVGHDLRSTCRR